MLLLEVQRYLLLLLSVVFICFCSLEQGYSKLQHDHRLGGHVINSFPDFSILDCVKECLVTVRCLYVNYHKGANFCEINYDGKMSAQ